MDDEFFDNIESYSKIVQAAIVGIRELKQLLRDAYPIVKHDAQMMEAITRHAPLSPEDQHTHDTTKFPSEVWLDKYHEVFGDPENEKTNVQ